MQQLCMELHNTFFTIYVTFNMETAFFTIHSQKIIDLNVNTTYVITRLLISSLYGHLAFICLTDCCGCSE